MVIIILVALLILGIAFFQVVQGLFSALITAILTVLCAAVALNYHESLAAYLFEASGYARDPSLMYAASLIALFVIPLLALRIIFDMTIRGNVVFGPWPDRIGGGVLGLVTGTVMAGILMIAMQMLPTGSGVFGYHPYGPSMERNQSLSPFQPDRFTAGMFGGLSNGSLSGDQRWSLVHSDYIREIHAARNTPMQPGRTDARPGALKIVSLHTLSDAQLAAMGRGAAYTFNDAWARCVSDRVRGQTGVAWLFRVEVLVEAEPDGWVRVPGTHFRLTSDGREDYFPIAYLTYQTVQNRASRSTSGPASAGDWQAVAAMDKDGLLPGDLSIIREAKTLHRGENEGRLKMTIDLVYRLPEGESPLYMTFRRVAQASVADIKKTDFNEQAMRAAALAREK
jgi:hypothetical protein